MSDESKKPDGLELAGEMMDNAKPLATGVLVRLEVLVLDSQSITLVVQKRPDLSATLVNLLLLDTLGKIEGAVIQVMKEQEQEEAQESNPHEGIH